MKQLLILLLLTCVYLISIQLEKSLNISSNKVILFERIDFSWKFITLIDIVFMVLMIVFVLMAIKDDGILIIYVVISKFFDLIPSLLDLIDFLLIYQDKSIDVKQQHSLRFIRISLGLSLIRFVMGLNVIRRKCDNQQKRQLLIIFDLIIFFLISIALMQNSNVNFIRITRNLLLGVLIYRLNDLFGNETVWLKFIPSIRNNSRETKLYIQWILSIRWILSSLIVFLFFIFALKSTRIDEDGYFLFMKNIYNLFKSSISHMVTGLTLLYVIHWDTTHHRQTLEEYGILSYSIGLDLIPTSQLTTERTCLVCLEDQNINEFNGLSFPQCQHENRSVCNSCLVHHVQQACRITFTDDIYCPELQCAVKFDYQIVKRILSRMNDKKYLEQYDQYVVQRQLEQMPEFIWCSNSSCNAGQLNEGGAENNIVTCHQCHSKTCFTHKVKWHEGITCVDYDLRLDPIEESSRRWIVENSKKCPQCPYQIEKNDGCDHMKCIKCQHEFCWSCLADFQPIRADGNHRHNEFCKHYAAYNP